MAKTVKSQSNKAVGYIRVSTDHQDISLDLQEAKIRAYCMLHDLDLVDVLREEDVSGTVPLNDREQGSKLNGMIAGGVRHVVSLKLDRLFRNAANALGTAEAWHEQGVAVHFVDMGGASVNTGSSAGKMFFTMLAGFAEFERNLISERITAALKHKKDTGKVYSATPYGFKAVNGMLEMNEDEQIVLKMMRTMKESGASLGKIANELNERQIPAKKGGVWFPQTIKMILAA